VVQSRASWSFEVFADGTALRPVGTFHQEIATEAILLIAVGISRAAKIGSAHTRAESPRSNYPPLGRPTGEP